LPGLLHIFHSALHRNARNCNVHIVAVEVAFIDVMVQKAEKEYNMPPSMMTPKPKILSTLLLAVTLFPFVSAAAVPAIFVNNNDEASQKISSTTSTLRYRRHRILQVESSILKDSAYGLDDTTISSQQERVEKKLHSLDLDISIWERLLQKDSSLSLSMPTAPQEPTTVPVVVPTPPVPSVPSSTRSPTTSPFKECKSVNRSDAVLAIVGDITSNLGSIPSTSPQGMAFDWIVNEDDIDPCINPDSIQQRYVLATLFESTEGDSWSNTTGWLSLESECSWYGIVCNDEDEIERFELGK
jgi:hypothetical protein